MWRATGVSLRARARWRPVSVAVAAIGLAGCGDGGSGASDAATTSTNRAAKSEKIVIRVHADLQDVVDKGEVLDGSSLGDAPFCRGGTFSGSHGSTLRIDRTFECP